MINVKAILTAALIMSMLPVSLSAVEAGSSDNAGFGTRGSIITVNQNGTGDYSTIQEAIDNAGPGNTISVGNGTFIESLVITSSIELVGSGIGETIIQGDGKGDGNVITINADGCLISDLSITGRFSDLGEGADVDAADMFTGIVVAGDGNTVQRCNISDNDVGITILETDDNTIQNCICSSNQLAGILDRRGSRNVIRNNTAKENDYGIVARVSRDSLVENNLCSSNRKDGIWLHDGEEMKVPSNECKNNGGSGIYLQGSSENEITNNVCTNNKRSGIYIWISHDNKIRDNVCNGNGKHGIEIGEYSRGNKVHENDCTNNEEEGIYSDYLASGNDIENNRGSVRDASRVTTGIQIVCGILVLIIIIVLVIVVIKIVRRKKKDIQETS